MTTVRTSRRSMATRFECLLESGSGKAVLPSESRARLRAMGEALLDEAGRVERVLSRYDPTSEVSRLNARGARGPMRISPLLLRTLAVCDLVTRMSGGAFSAAAFPLMEAWGMQGGDGKQEGSGMYGTGHRPDTRALQQASEASRWQQVHVDADKRTVVFDSEGVSLDFGGIGKGVALDEIRYRANEVDVQRALVHGGTSSILAIGGPFRVGIAHPDDTSADDTGADDHPTQPLAAIDLQDEALGVSASFGRSGHDGERRIGHVMDPRSGMPLTEARLSAVRADSAALADAWATALLVQPALRHASTWPDGLRECWFWEF